MNNSLLLDKLRKDKLVAVVSIPDPDLAVPLAKALYKGNIKFQITLLSVK